MKPTLLVLALAALFTCRAYTFRNEQLPPIPRDKGRASFQVPDRLNDRLLVILAISGGGSRAAYFAGSTMLELERMGILQRVDVISAVSGGTIPAAYYALSKDGQDKYFSQELLWNPPAVKKITSQDYLTPWIRRFFYPQNACLYYTTDYDRGDIMAETFNAGLFKSFGEVTFSDLKADRPNLILNSTDGTYHSSKANQRENPCERCDNLVFTFTEEDFSAIDSDIYNYPLAQAVTASASFPGVFPYRTLKDHKGDRYLHVFDGGVVDNLGFSSVFQVIETNYKSTKRFDRVVIILIDAYTKYGGVSDLKPDPRNGLHGLILDNSPFDAFDRMLTKDRENKLQQMTSFCGTLTNCELIKISFDAINYQALGRSLNEIGTSFSIDEDQVKTLDKAILYLFSEKNNTEPFQRLSALKAQLPQLEKQQSQGEAVKTQ